MVASGGVSDATWQNLLVRSVLRDANYTWREETGRWRGRLGQGGKNEMLMWKYNETDEREAEGGRGRREEIKGDRRGDITLMI